MKDNRHRVHEEYAPTIETRRKERRGERDEVSNSHRRPVCVHRSLGT